MRGENGYGYRNGERNGKGRLAYIKQDRERGKGETGAIGVGSGGEIHKAYAGRGCSGVLGVLRREGSQ